MPEFEALKNMSKRIGFSATPLLDAFEVHPSGSDARVRFNSQLEKIDAPCVRVVRPGTLWDYREWKVKTKGAASGHVKVSVVI